MADAMEAVQDKGRGSWNSFEIRNIMHKHPMFKRPLASLDFEKVKVSAVLEPCNNDRKWVRGYIVPKAPRDHWSLQKRNQELTCKQSSAGGELLFPKIFKVAQSLCIDDEFVVNSFEDCAMVCLNGRIPSEEVEWFFLGPGGSIGPPWQIPRRLPQAAKINALLERSMAAQRNSLLDTEFDQCFMSGDSLTVCGMIHTILKYAGIESKFKTGVLRHGDQALPMVWLTIRGHVIDNTYHHWPRDEPLNRRHLVDVDDKLIELKRDGKVYKEVDNPEKPPEHLAEVFGKRTCVTDPKLLKAYATPQNIGKYLALRKGHPNAYPNFQLYALSLILNMSAMDPSLILAEMSSDHPPLRLLNQCWTCDKKSQSLKTCVDCQEARYCDVGCQNADWPHHKLLHKDLKANRKFHKI